jgi:TonB family protein
MKTILTLLCSITFVFAYAQSAEEEPVYAVVQQMPYYIVEGCEGLPRAELKACSNDGMLEEINSKLRYPKEAVINKVEGMVVLTLVIDQEGLIESIKVKRSIGYGCDEEAVRLIKGLNNDWMPGLQDGEPKKVRFNVPINFKLPK